MVCESSIDRDMIYQQDAKSAGACKWKWELYSSATSQVSGESVGSPSVGMKPRYGGLQMKTRARVARKVAVCQAKCD